MRTRQSLPIRLLYEFATSITVGPTPWSEVMTVAAHQVKRLRGAGRRLSRNDVRVIVMAQLVRQLSQMGWSHVALAMLVDRSTEVEGVIEQLHRHERRTLSSDICTDR